MVKIHTDDNGSDMMTKVLTFESPHLGVKGEFVGETGPSGCDTHEAGYWISAG